MFDRLGPWLQENFWVVWLGSLSLSTITFLIAALWRRSRGLPLRRPVFTGSLFEENWRSGGRGIVGASNCAWVSLLPDRLVTGLHFPFNLGVPRRLSRWAGLDIEVPLADVIAVDNESSSGRQRLRITYRSPSGESFFWLDLRDPEGLRAAIAAVRAASPPRGSSSAAPPAVGGR